MAITLVGDGGLSALSSTTNLNVALPSGIQAGDVLVAWITGRGTSGTLGAPSGWTAVAAQSGPTTGHYSRGWWKVAGSSETVPRFTSTVAGLMYGSISAWRGVDTSVTIDATGSSTNGGAAATFAAAAITTVTNGAVAIWLWSTPDDNDLGSETQGTKAYDYQTTLSSDGAHACVYLTKATAGSTGTTTITQITNGNDNWASATLALRPVADDSNPATTWFPGSGLEVAVEVAFDTDPLTGAATWTDITTDVMSMTLRRGRSSEFEATSPGTASFVLRNDDRKYDPEHAAGIYNGKLTPMREVRVRARYSSTNYNVWRGFIESWSQSYNPPRWATCEPSAIDGFTVLANRRVQTSAYGSIVAADSPAVYWPLRDESGNLFIDQSGNQAHASGSGAVSAVVSVLPSESYLSTGARYLDGGGSISGPAPDAEPLTIEAWIQLDHPASGVLLSTATSTTDSLVLSSEELGDGYGNATGQYLFAYFSNAAANTRADGIEVCDLPLYAPFHLVATCDLDTLKVYLNTTTVLTYSTVAGTLTNTNIIGTVIANKFRGDGAPLRVGHVAVYTRALTATEIAEHYEAGAAAFDGQKTGARLTTILDSIGWPQTQRTLSTGQSYLASWRPAGGSALDELQKVADTEQGLLHIDAAGSLVFRDRQWRRDDTTADTSQAAFSDDPGVGEYGYVELATRPADTEMIRNAVDVSSDEFPTVTVVDIASVAAYTERRHSVSTALRTPTTAKLLAQSILDESAEPVFRVEQITVAPRGDATLWPEVLSLDLGSRVTVERTPQGVGSAITQQLQVVGIAHEVGPDDWRVSYMLTPPMVSVADGPWFTLGDTLDSGNLLPY